jgi:cytochrome c553
MLRRPFSNFLTPYSALEPSTDHHAPKNNIKMVAAGIWRIFGIALLGTIIVFILIGRDLSRTFDIATSEIAVPDDEAHITEGERLARLRGCYNGCHGKTTTGGVMIEMPDGTSVVAPDLPDVAQKYSNKELERLIRHGIRPNGTSVILIMPSSMFYHLSDDDLGAIIAFLRSQTPGDEKLPDSKIGPLARLLLMYYKNLAGTILAAELIDHDAPRIDPATNDLHVRGRYLALTVCTECHWTDLRGAPDGSTPTLAVVAAYSIDNFRKLMRTGEPIGGRQLDLMSSVAVRRFAHFTDREIDALHAYLQTLATIPAEPRTK